MTGPGGASGDLDELLRLASEATAGARFVAEGAGPSDCYVRLPSPARTSASMNQADAEFIAACSPEVVAALVERVREAEAERGQAQSRDRYLDGQFRDMDRLRAELADAHRTRGEATARLAAAIRATWDTDSTDGTADGMGELVRVAAAASRPSSLADTEQAEEPS